MRESDRKLLMVLVLSAAAIAVAFYAAKNAARVISGPAGGATTAPSGVRR